MDDFLVTISENHPDETQIWRILLDDEFKAKLKIVKKDDETKRPVLVAGTEFKHRTLPDRGSDSPGWLYLKPELRGDRSGFQYCITDGFCQRGGGD